MDRPYFLAGRERGGPSETLVTSPNMSSTALPSEPNHTSNEDNVVFSFSPNSNLLSFNEGDLLLKKVEQFADSLQRIRPISSSDSQSLDFKPFFLSTMTVSVLSNLAFICSVNALLLMLTGLSLSSPIRSPESRHRASVRGDMGVNPLLDAQDFLIHFLSTMNLTELRSQPRPLSALKEPPEYMLELYNRFANDYTAVPSANTVQSFKNEDFTPYSSSAKGVRMYPLQFNFSMCHHEHILLTELHLFTQAQKAQRPHAGIDCKVTIYKVHEGIVWTKEVGKEGRGRDNQEVVETKDLEELVTKHIHTRDNSWVAFDLTHMVPLWLKSGCRTLRLEAHISHLGSGRATQEVPGQGEKLAEIDIERSLEGKHNAVMIVFSDNQSGDHTRDKQVLNQLIENDLPGDMSRNQQPSRGHVNRNSDHAHQDEQALQQLQSNLIFDTPSRIRRSVKSQPCKRIPLYVDFKDIGWDKWIIQPVGYDAYKCNGVCNLPMTSEVSPTKHAIVQALLSAKSPESASHACCVPIKLEPISLLYHENSVITFKHKYDEMVVAECGCR